jgi:Bacteriocin-protection, YdeI or OmpD-Associated
MQYKIFKNPSNMLCVSLGAKLISILTANKNKRALCIINKTTQLHCAILRTKENEYYIIISSAICKQLKLKAGSIIDCEFSIDESEHQFEMPETLQEVLASDDEAKKVFDGLTDGNKRSIMHLVAIVKNTDKQIERALLIAEKLKLGITQARLILKK